jgi:outer membrane protein assembly factor BamB
MSRRITRMSMAVAAVAAFGMLAVTGASASGAATNAPPHPAASAAAAAVPGTQLWMKHYRNVNGSIPYYDNRVWAAASPTGRTVFVTGSSYGGSATDWDYATVAYNADTGKQLWVTRYNGPANRHDFARAITVTPDGSTVFVTGQSNGLYAAVAYNAATGKQLWVKISASGTPYSVTVSPGGGRVFVTGFNRGQYGTVAYRADNGRQLWVTRYNGPGNGDTAFSIAASPTERTVFVTGESAGPGQRGQYATVAYDAATGKQLWVKRYGNGRAYSVAVSPGGGRVFVTGESITTSSGGDYATVAYRADNGRQLWVTRYNGPANHEDAARSVVASPTERTVFVTGSCDGWSNEYGNPVGNDYATLAYDAATGKQLWVTRYNGPGNGNDYANSMTVSPTGRTVFVTGESLGTANVSGYATLAYNAATGKQLWLQRYGPGSASSIAASPRGQVFVAGGTGTNDYTTIAYGG